MDTTAMAAADRAAIENVLGLYCRAIDRLDVELLKSLYHPDGVDDHGAFTAGAHEFADRIIAMQKELCESTLHTVTHSVIDVRGENASCESYYLAIIVVAEGATSIERFFGPAYLNAQRVAGTVGQRHEFLCCGRYLDQFQKRDGAWRIHRRRVTNEWGVCRAQSMVSEGVPSAFASAGSRDRHDPVYGLVLG
jgi:hypothetical protein